MILTPQFVFFIFVHQTTTTTHLIPLHIWLINTFYFYILSLPIYLLDLMNTRRTIKWIIHIVVYIFCIFFTWEGCSVQFWNQYFHHVEFFLTSISWLPFHFFSKRSLAILSCFLPPINHQLRLISTYPIWYHHKLLSPFWRLIFT